MSLEQRLTALEKERRAEEGMVILELEDRSDEAIAKALGDRRPGLVIVYPPKERQQ